MSDRRDFYWQETVTQTSLDEAFDFCENADHVHRVDTGLTGIVTGLGVTAQAVPNLTVNVAAGTAYDANGRRILVGGTQVVDLAPAQPSVPGNSKIVSVCIRFDRNLQDPEQDGNGATVYTHRFESFEIFLEQGAEAPTGTEVAPSKPSDGLVLADVTLTQGDTQIQTADIDMTTPGRRDWTFEVTGLSPLPDVQVGTLVEAIDANRQTLHDHVTSGGVLHDATSIEFDNAAAGLPGAPATVQAAIDELVTGASGQVTLGADYQFSGAVDFAGASVEVQSTFVAGSGVSLTDASGPIIRTGFGSPEGVVTAVQGSLWLRRDGGNDTSVYVKASGSGNTGWRAVTTAAP